MNPYIFSLLLLGLGLGTSITFASSHWLMAWMGLEISTLSILPLMAQSHHPRAVEATTKYFLAQATAAATLLFASCTNAWLTGQWDILQTHHSIPTTMLVIALALKMGLAPMHSWMPEVLQGLSLDTGLILATWQKLAPFALIVQVQSSAASTTLLALGVMSLLVGGWGGLNQTQLRKLLAYSSIAHMGWMLIVLQYSPTLTLLALFTYIILTSSTFLIFKLTNATSISALAAFRLKFPTITALVPLILLSLGGLPPLTGFVPKWFILHELTKQDLSALAATSALMALLSLYFYLRLSYAMALTMYPNNISGIPTWRLTHTKATLLTALFTIMSISLLPLTPAAMALIMP
uniref:NADH-ubiquinone oxidoreductase chain 2 n=1 Tax=Paralichthyidae sp. TaxID=3075841 RepID=A0AA95Z422_9PLEU|nr:NADH dehydrogenase subunit 2 [Paralichthyidae sp.]